MAVVLASIAFWAPVVLTIPGDDEQLETVKFRARYKRLSKSERQALDRSVMAANLTTAMRTALAERAANPETREKERKQVLAQLEAEPIDDTDYVNAVLVDWDLKDKTGESIPFTPANLAELVEAWDGLEAALVMGHINADRKAKEAAKNSAAPSASI